MKKGHSYCENCINLALQFNSTCPMCRKNLRESDGVCN